MVSALALGARPLAAQESEDEKAALAAFQQAERLRQTGKYPEAVRAYEKAVARAERAWGLMDTTTAIIMNNLADTLRLQGRYAKAEPLFLRSLRILEAKLGKDHPKVAMSLNNLAVVYQAQARYSKAEALLQRSLRIFEAKLGKEQVEVAVVLNSLAELYRVQDQYQSAEPLYKHSLRILEAKLGKDHLHVATTLNNLALLYQAQGLYSRAEPLFVRNMRIMEAKLGTDHPSLARCLNNLARLYRDWGLHTKARPYYERALKIVETASGENRLTTALLLHALGQWYQDQGQYAKAEALFLRSVRMNESLLGKNDFRLATVLNDLAVLYQEQALYAMAEPLYRRSLEIRRSTLGPSHLDVASSLNNLAALYRDQGRYREAESLLQRSLKINVARVGEEHLAVANCLSNLAVFFHVQGKYGKAESLLRRALEIQEDKLGKDHHSLANTLNNLAMLSQDQGHYRRAERLLVRGLKIKEAWWGPNHPSVILSLINLAGLYAAQERWQEALTTFDRACRGLRRHVRLVLPALSSQEQLNFLRAKVQPSFQAALSLALVRPGDKVLAEQAAAWLVNGKGLTQEIQAEPLLLARSATDPRFRKVIGRLLKVRRQLANLTLAVPKAGAVKQHLARLDEMSRQEQHLARELGRESADLLGEHPWVELSAVRKAVPPDAVLINIARFPFLPFKWKVNERPGQTARYVAWVIPAANKGMVRLMDLGPADKIDAAVKGVRQRLQTAPRRIAKNGEGAAEKELAGPLHELAKQVLRPLLPHIDKSKHWILSPDAGLWLVPWAALPLPDGRSVIEKYQISHVVSGRELVARKADTPGKGALVLADPDFDLKPGRATRALAEGRALLPQERLPRFGRLPGTAAEARAITPALLRYLGGAPTIKTDKDALERVFKEVKSPRLLVVSTHGFFLPDQEDAIVPSRAGLEGRGLKLVERERPRPQGVKVRVYENPLLRCGLALAGANQRDQAGPDDEDGILTGLEIVGTDLRGTELVVLSACETGLGKVQNGEGVAGLRQAFQLAGARAVVATLWQIPDKETTALMTAFFENLAAKKGKAEALRLAQLHVIKQRRAKGKAAHPFYWAAFTLTGQWQ
jgi:CHAT domain-containing protein/Flp pilus assembly protein TadD